METPSYFSLAVELNHGLWPQKGRHEKTSDDEWNLITKGMKIWEDDDKFCWDLYNTMAVSVIERDETFALDCFDPLLHSFNRIQLLQKEDTYDKLFCKYIKTAVLEWHIFNNTYKGFWHYLRDTIITYAEKYPTHISITLSGDEDSD